MMDRAAQRARAELHAALKQADHLLFRQQRGHFVGERLRVQPARRVPVRSEERPISSSLKRGPRKEPLMPSAYRRVGRRSAVALTAAPTCRPAPG